MRNRGPWSIQETAGIAVGVLLFLGVAAAPVWLWGPSLMNLAYAATIIGAFLWAVWRRR